MALSIKNQELEAVARELAQLKRTSITEALLQSARLELSRERRKPIQDSKRHDKLRLLMQTAERGAKLPVLDNRTLEDMLYDANGLPK